MERRGNRRRAYDARSYTFIAFDTTKNKYIKFRRISKREKWNDGIRKARRIKIQV